MVAVFIRRMWDTLPCTKSVRLPRNGWYSPKNVTNTSLRLLLHRQNPQQTGHLDLCHVHCNFKELLTPEEWDWLKKARGIHHSHWKKRALPSPQRRLFTHRCDCAVRARDAAPPFNPSASRSLRTLPVVHSDSQRTQNAVDRHSWGGFTRSGCPRRAMRGALRRQERRQEHRTPRAGLRGHFHRRCPRKGSRCGAAAALRAPGLRGRRRSGSAAPAPPRRAAGGQWRAEPDGGGGTTAVMENFRLLHLLRVSSPVPAPSRLPRPLPIPAAAGAVQNLRRRGWWGVAASRRRVHRIPARFPLPSRPLAPATVVRQSHPPVSALGSLVFPSEPRALRWAQERGWSWGIRCPSTVWAALVSRAPRTLHGLSMLPMKGGRAITQGGQTMAGHPPHSRLAAADWRGSALLPAGQEPGSCFATPCPSIDSSQVSPHYPRQAPSGAVSLHTLPVWGAAADSKAPPPTSTEDRAAKLSKSSEVVGYLRKRKQDVLFPPLFPTGALSWITSLGGVWHSGSFPEGNVRGVCRLPSGSGLTRALLQVLKIASDCSEQLWRVRGTSRPLPPTQLLGDAGGRRGVERGRQILGEPAAAGCCSHAADAAPGR